MAQLKGGLCTAVDCDRLRIARCIDKRHKRCRAIHKNREMYTIYAGAKCYLNNIHYIIYRIGAKSREDGTCK